MKITVVSAPDTPVQVAIETSIYAPTGSIYLVPDNETFGTFVKTMYALEKERNEWIRRYDNAMKGLRFWESKAKEQK